MLFQQQFLRLLMAPKFDERQCLLSLQLMAAGSPRKLGYEIARQLLDLLPPSGSTDLWPKLSRAGCRIAYCVIRTACPERRATADDIPLLGHFARVVRFADEELDRRNAIGHRAGFIRVYGDRLAAYVYLVLGLRDMSEPDAPHPAVQGCLVERMVIAGSSFLHLTTNIAHALLQSSPKDQRKAFCGRVREVICIGMANPYEPEFDGSNKDKKHMINWNLLVNAAPTRLTEILMGIRVGRVIDVADRPIPQFARPLTLNPLFRNAAQLLPEKFDASLN